MHAGVVRPGCRVIGLYRQIGGDRAGAHVADAEAAFADQQLMPLVDHGQRAHDLGQLAHDGGAASELLFEQLASENVEPEQRIGGGVVGRPLAEMADVIRKDRDAAFFDHRFLPERHIIGANACLRTLRA